MSGRIDLFLSPGHSSSRPEQPPRIAVERLTTQETPGTPATNESSRHTIASEADAKQHQGPELVTPCASSFLPSSAPVSNENTASMSSASNDFDLVTNDDASIADAGLSRPLTLTVRTPEAQPEPERKENADDIILHSPPVLSSYAASTAASDFELLSPPASSVNNDRDDHGRDDDDDEFEASQMLRLQLELISRAPSQLLAAPLAYAARSASKPDLLDSPVRSDAAPSDGQREETASEVWKDSRLPSASNASLRSHSPRSTSGFMSDASLIWDDSTEFAALGQPAAQMPAKSKEQR